MSEVAQNGLGAQEQSEEISKSSEPINFLRHCPHCGSNKFEAHGTKEFICGACGFDFFVNSAAAVVALVTDEEGRLMLTRRAREPWRGALDLPGGFVDPGEGAEDALRREVREELGVEVTAMRYVCSYPNEYIFSRYKVRTTDLAFECQLSSSVVAAADDVSEIIWLAPNEIALDDIPATSIRNIVRHWLESRN